MNEKKAKRLRRLIRHVAPHLEGLETWYIDKTMKQELTMQGGKPTMVNKGTRFVDPRCFRGIYLDMKSQGSRNHRLSVLGVE